MKASTRVAVKPPLVAGIRFGRRVIAATVQPMENESASDHPRGDALPQDDSRPQAGQPLYFDSHMHTPLCKHADGHPREYVAAGMAAGLRGVIFTCHSPMPDRFSHAVRMTPDEFDDYVALIDEGRAAAASGFEVRLGMESDFFPGMEGWLEELHGRADFDYVLGSVHWHIPEYRAAFYRGDRAAFEKQYFEHLAESAETGLFDSLAHPDLIKNASPDQWNFAERHDDLARALDRIAATGVAMELNTSGINKVYAEMNPGPEMLAMMCERDIPVVVGSDSHVPFRVGASFDAALASLEDAGYSQVGVFEKRRRCDIDISSARASLGLRAELVGTS